MELVAEEWLISLKGGDMGEEFARPSVRCFIYQNKTKLKSRRRYSV